MILNKVINKYKTIYRYFLRKPYFKALRIMISSDVTIICNNCTGSRISQDLHYRYNSPTIGLYIKYPEYIIFLENLKEFMKCELVFKDKKSPYPIGYLCWNDLEITIYFLHYQTVEEAKKKWDRRKRRINWNKLLIIGTDTDNCSIEDVTRFLQLPYQCKIFFSNRDDKSVNNKNYIFVNELAKKKVFNGYDYAHILYKYLIKQSIKFD